jgi:hypothetical protein
MNNEQDPTATGVADTDVPLFGIRVMLIRIG